MKRISLSGACRTAVLLACVVATSVAASALGSCQVPLNIGGPARAFRHTVPRAETTTSALDAWSAADVVEVSGESTQLLDISGAYRGTTAPRFYRSSQWDLPHEYVFGSGEPWETSLVDGANETPTKIRLSSGPAWILSLTAYNAASVLFDLRRVKLALGLDVVADGNVRIMVSRDTLPAGPGQPGQVEISGDLPQSATLTLVAPEEFNILVWDLSTPPIPGARRVEQGQFLPGSGEGTITVSVGPREDGDIIPRVRVVRTK